MCPTRVFVKELPNETVTVNIFETKSHHNIDLKYMGLDDKISQDIESKLSLNIPINNILNSIRHHFHP